MRYSKLFKAVHTACISAPFPPDPLTTATALLLFPRFGLFTTICEEPKASEAGRFSADITAAWNGSQLKRWWGRKCVVDMSLLNVFVASWGDF